LPMELRKKMDIKEGDALEIFTDSNMIVLKKYQPSCIFCGDARDIFYYKGHNICPECVKDLGSV